MSARILVVDDNEVNVKLLVAMLTHDYSVVSTAADGFERWRRSRPNGPTSSCST
jgi:CheY-like chemotaxis protein